MEFNNITKKLKNNKTKQSIFYKNITNLLNIRRKQKAFHPNASRLNLNFGPKFMDLKE